MSESKAPQVPEPPVIRVEPALAKERMSRSEINTALAMWATEVAGDIDSRMKTQIAIMTQILSGKKEIKINFVGTAPSLGNDITVIFPPRNATGDDPVTLHVNPSESKVPPQPLPATRVESALSKARRCEINIALAKWAAADPANIDSRMRVQIGIMLRVLQGDTRIELDFAGDAPILGDDITVTFRQSNARTS